MKIWSTKKGRITKKYENLDCSETGLVGETGQRYANALVSFHSCKNVQLDVNLRNVAWIVRYFSRPWTGMVSCRYELTHAVMVVRCCFLSTFFFFLLLLLGFWVVGLLGCWVVGCCLLVVGCWLLDQRVSGLNLHVCRDVVFCFPHS